MHILSTHIKKHNIKGVVIVDGILISPRPKLSIQGRRVYSEEYLQIAINKWGKRDVVEAMLNQKITLTL